MTNLPRVSVVIPAFNCEAYISDALDSVFNQDYPNIEVIVVNDGSTDSTLGVLKSYSKQITIIDQVNSGSAVARSIGMAQASGEYIAFLDGDDLWLPSKLKKQVEFLEKNDDYGLVYSNWTTWKPNENGEFETNDIVDVPVIKQAASGWLYGDLLLDCVVCTPCVLMRYKIYEQVGNFDASLRRGQDYDYWLRVSRITKIHKLNEVYAVYRIHGESICHRPTKINFEYVILKNAVEKWGYSYKSVDLIDPKIVHKRLSEICFDFAYQHYYSGSLNIAFESFLTSLRYRPFRVKTWLYLGMLSIKLVNNMMIANVPKL